MILESEIAQYRTPYLYGKPVLSPTGRSGDPDSVAVDIPFVFRHQDRFRMLYTGFDGIGYQSMMAESRDLLDWRRLGTILPRRQKGSGWDCNGGAATWILKKSDSLWDVPKPLKLDGKYWMVYHSYPGSGYESGPAKIGLAFCDEEDLLTWHFPDEPCFSWENGEDWEKGGLYKAAIIRKDQQWYLFYNAKNERENWTEQTGYAVSDDLRHWKRSPDNPVLRVSPSGYDSRFLSDPYIVRDGEFWLDFYFGFGDPGPDGHRHAVEGLARSKDLIHWEKSGQPLMNIAPAGEIGCGHIHKASMVYWNGVLYHFFCGTRPAKEGEPQQWGEYRAISVAASRPWR